MLALLISVAAMANCTSPPPDSENTDRPGFGAVEHLSTEIVIDSYQLDSQVVDGQDTELTLSVLVTNTGPGAFSHASATMAPMHANATLLDDTVAIPAMGPGDSVTSSDPIVIRIPTVDLGTLQQVLAANTLPEWVVSGIEIPVFAPGVYVMDEATDLVWTRMEIDATGRPIHWFSAHTALIDNLVVGDIVMDEEYRPTNMFCSDFPLLVDDVIESGGEVGIIGSNAPVDIFDLFSSFAVQSLEGGLATNPYAPHDSDPDRDDPGCVAADVCPEDVPAPTRRFNLVNIGGVVDVSGSLSMRKTSVRFTGWFRNGEVQGGKVQIDTNGFATLQAAATADFTLDPTETDIFTFQIPVADVGHRGVDPADRLVGQPYLDDDLRWPQQG